MAKLGNKITLNWVPGHEGHMGNEVADRLAKGGVSQPTHGPGPWVPASNCVLKKAINNWCDVLHEEKWTRRPDCRQSKIILPSTNHKWKSILSKTKNQIKAVVQIVTGHANLKRHRHIMKLEEDPICECGEDEETSIHVLTECPKFALKRRHYLGDFKIKPENVNKLELKQIINFAQATKKWT